HRYHTREMVATILDNWAAYVQGLGLPRLLDAVIERAQALPARLRAELVVLRARLRGSPRLDPERLLDWGGRVAAVLLVVIMLANTVAPDSVFAKAAGGHMQAARPSHTVAQSAAPATRSALTGSGYSHTSFGRNQIVDVFGNAYAPRRYYIYRSHSYYGRSYRSRPGPTPTASPTVSPSDLPVAPPAEPPEATQATYYLTEDALVLDTNDVVVTLGDDHYLLVADDALAMLGAKSAEPIYALYRDPALVTSLVRELQNQRLTLQMQIADLANGVDRQRWMGTVLPGVRRHVDEVANLRATDQQLADTIARLSTASEAVAPPAGGKEVFAGVYALPSGVVAL